MGPYFLLHSDNLLTIIMWDEIIKVGRSDKRMATSPAQLKANKKYQEEKLEEIKFRVPKGRKTQIQVHAKKQGESTNAFILRAVDQTIQSDEQERHDKYYDRV